MLGFVKVGLRIVLYSDVNCIFICWDGFNVVD